MFPLHMEDLEIHGDRPPVGTEVACQITIHELERHRIRVEAQFVRPDGTVWMRINDWEDWRFHWPGRYRDSFRQPRDYLVGEELPLADPALGPPAGAKAVWLEPPADMGRPVWRDVLEFTQLGPEERAGLPGFGRYRRAALAAALGPDRGQGGRPPALERRRPCRRFIPPTWRSSADEHGRPLLTRLGEPRPTALPAISIAHADGVAVALAVLDPTARVGIDVEPIVERPAGFEATAFTAGERALLDRWSGASRAEWVTRFWCAKEAAAKASGLGSAGGPASAQVVDADEDTGVIHVRLAPELLTARPDGDLRESPACRLGPARPSRLGLDHWKRNQNVISVPSRTEILDDVIAVLEQRPRACSHRARSPKTRASSPISAWRRSTPLS